MTPPDTREQARATARLATYRSNNGKGPLMARIVRVVGDVATMERWNPSRPRRREQFTLPLAFLSSPHCGWRVM